MKGGKIKMKKSELLKVLANQNTQTKKTTRQDIIALVYDMVEYHIKDNAEINGLSSTRSNSGVNLGEVVEVILKSLFKNKLEKAQSDKHYDLIAKGEKVEVKFSTSDAYAHPINAKEVVDYYLIATYSKKVGGQVFKVPFSMRNEIKTNNQNRVVANQDIKFLDRQLTKKLFGVVGY